MKQKIYIDVLIGINLFINYFLLLSVTKFLSIKVKRIRIIAASALGAFCSLIILLPELNLFLSFLLKIVISALIILIAYPICGLKQFIRELTSFYIISFAFAGFMIAMWYFIAPQGLIIKNSVVYFNISPLMLIVLTVICYLVIRFIQRITGRENPKELFCNIIIEFNGKSVSCTAKVDTGNTLTEPFSNAPVVVVDKKALHNMVPDQSSGKIRFVPFQDVSGGGLLQAFKPDKLTVCFGEKNIETDEVYIALTNSKFGTFSALLNPDLLQKETA